MGRFNRKFYFVQEVLLPFRYDLPLYPDVFLCFLCLLSFVCLYIFPSRFLSKKLEDDHSGERDFTTFPGLS